MHSTIQFSRWEHIQNNTWPFKVYKQYNEELSRMIWADKFAHQFTYKQLALSKADWEDTPSKHFIVPSHNNNFETLKDWSNGYEELQNWIYLNCVMAMSAFFETYLNSVVTLAIESDPGVLLGAPHQIDGTILLKNGSLRKEVYTERVNECTKGTWTVRCNAFSSIFGTIPPLLKSNIALLDQIRTLRNKVGHAFGRDIEQSRSIDINKIQPAERVSQKRVIKYLRDLFNIVKSIDDFLLNNHIGEYQSILAYHKCYPTLNKDIHINLRADLFKKNYGKNDVTIGKTFCRGLAKYYESI